jgi:hypothetical protein
MANIERLAVRIEAIEGAPERCHVVITYALRLQYWEVGSWFSEVVEIHSGSLDQSQATTQLRRLTCHPWRLDAEKESLVDSKSYLLERAVPPQPFDTKELPHDTFVRATVIPKLPVGSSPCCAQAEWIPGSST